MDYEKKYKEARERAKQKRGSAAISKDDLEYIFPELKKSEDEGTKIFLFDYIQKAVWSKQFPPKKEILDWLEKQGEQKFADKVEPKFHKGEWITNGDYTWKIVEVKPLDYILQSQDGNIVDDTISHVDEQFHSFTIQDAKDGDVIALNNEVFIYAHRKQIYSIAVAHCFVDSAGGFYLDGEFVYGEYGKTISPATKEQRDLLFSKMKEAGYEWSADKKELKKVKKAPQKFMVGDTIKYNGTEYKITEITPNGYKVYALTYDKDAASLISFSAPAILVEQKPAWSEEDETYSDHIITAIKSYYTDDKGKENPWREELLRWLKSLKDRVIPQPKQEWSKEDERIRQSLITDLSNATTNDEEVKNEINKDITWLKSLRPQSQWKPSEEQVKFLQKCIEAYNKVTFPTEVRVLSSLYNDLKKLK